MERMGNILSLSIRWLFGYLSEGFKRKMYINIRGCIIQEIYTCDLKKVNSSDNKRKNRHERRLLWTAPSTKDITLINNGNNSNLYFNNNKKIMKEGLVRFFFGTKRHSLGIIWKNRILKREKAFCINGCQNHGTLSHILKRYNRNFLEIVASYNDVISIMVQVLKTYKKDNVKFEK
jgi:hypothetical protein